MNFDYYLKCKYFPVVIFYNFRGELTQHKSIYQFLPFLEIIFTCHNVLQDSIVDLVNGLGAPLSKVIISAPVQAYDFTLQNEQYSAVGSPATELRSISRDELCRQMNKKANWTLERDQDQAAPYIFK